MGWSIGYDEAWQRDIGYGVPAYCDHPDCNEEIHRGIAYVCGGEPCGGEDGCGLHFCARHLDAWLQLCGRCEREKPPYEPKPDHPNWIRHKLTDPSWQEWREQNPAEVADLRTSLAASTGEAASG